MVGENLDLVLAGAAFGLLVSIVGAVLEYRIFLRKSDTPTRPHTSLLHLFGGVLCFLGLVAVVVSLVWTDSIAPALVMGIGVGIGFYAGFILLLMGWLVRSRLSDES